MKKSDIWLWAHPAGSFTGKHWGDLLENSTIKPGEAATYMHMENAVMVRSWGRPATEDFPSAMEEMKNLKQVKWSVIGDSLSGRTPFKDLEKVLEMKQSYPNLNGVMLDDFFPVPNNPEMTVPRMNLDEMAAMRAILDQHHMDVWAVYYEHQLNFDISKYIPFLDAINFWTWFGQNIDAQRNNITKLKAQLGSKRIVMGIYMWDFGNRKPLTASQMEAQFDNAEYLYDREIIQNVIFLGSCICDRNLDAVKYVRDRMTTLQG